VSLKSFLEAVVGILEEAGVAYMLTGSLAAAYYATPRATQDIDVVVEVAEGGIDHLVERLSAAGYYVDGTAAREALRTQGQFNAIDPVSGWKVDLIVRKERPFSSTEFERREMASLLGVEVWLASLEDVLIAKLEWAKLGDSALQRGDAAQLVERAGERLDLSYLEAWIRELGLESEWNDIRDRLERGRPEGGRET